MPGYEVYQDKAGEFRWRLRALNGEIIADSNESYKSFADCEHGIKLVKELSTETEDAQASGE